MHDTVCIFGGLRSGRRGASYSLELLIEPPTRKGLSVSPGLGLSGAAPDDSPRLQNGYSPEPPASRLTKEVKTKRAVPWNTTEKITMGTGPNRS